ncbi:type II secretion system protein GspL [Thaumasiovibrio subtropicus]|uniref:type II secretion system protein GspL n=1 Tax=Thaumasiovibrio subtropicus TaxID=1891207 RepID=UPI000B35459D|nr:type II secretion system protein GspL [Thaumasiovibrio subtropicus]
MSEFLTIRLSNRSDAAVPWLVWSPQQKEVIASGTLGSITQLDELKEYAPQRQIIVLVDAAAMVLTSVTLPPGSGRQIGQVLPFLLEEELAQDIDSLHIQLLAKRGDQGDVAIVEHTLMASWIAALQDAGLTAKKFVPDCLCLPKREEAFSAAELDGQWLVRTEEHHGAALDSEWLPLWLHEDNVVAHFTPKPANAVGEWKAETPELVMQLLTLGAIDSGVNLLSGAYRQTPSWKKHLKPWRKVAVVVGLWLAVVAGDFGLSIYRSEQLASQYQAESERIFRSLFPSVNRIPTQSWMRRQMESELSRLTGEDSGEGILPWLAELEPSFKKVPQFSLTSLRFDHNRSELRLQGEANDFAPFEQMRVLLSEQYEVEQGQLNRRDEKVQGMLTLRRKS